MNNQVLLLVEPIVLILLGGLGYFIWKSVKARKDDQAVRKAAVEAAGRFVEAVGKLTEATDGLSRVPKIIEGNFKICEALVLEVGKLRLANQEFRALLIPPTDAKQTLQQTSEGDSAAVFDIATLISGGMSWEDAAGRVKANQDRESQFSGVSMEGE